MTVICGGIPYLIITAGFSTLFGGGVCDLLSISGSLK